MQQCLVRMQCRPPPPVQLQRRDIPRRRHPAQPDGLRPTAQQGLRWLARAPGQVPAAQPPRPANAIAVRRRLRRARPGARRLGRAPRPASAQASPTPPRRPANDAVDSNRPRSVQPVAGRLSRAPCVAALPGGVVRSHCQVRSQKALAGRLVRAPSRGTLRQRSQWVALAGRLSRAPCRTPAGRSRGGASRVGEPRVQGRGGDRLAGARPVLARF